jgi:membrane-associated protease RseP (regulator of RpoE activity)
VEILLYILGIVIILFGLLISIGLHEIGHLVPAKKFGVYVSQYMIGLGPTIWSRKVGDTEYGIKAIPLGGYISMAGMFPPAPLDSKVRKSSARFFQTLMQDARTSSAESLAVGGEERAFYKLATWKRVIIMLGGPTMNLLIGIVLYTVLLCGIGIPMASTTIDRVAPCLQAAAKQGEPCSASASKSPAASAGLKIGDRLKSIDGASITSWDQATKIIRESAGRPIEIVVARAGGVVTLTATPATQNDVGVLGITSELTYAPQPISAVVPQIGANIAGVAQAIVTLPQRIVVLGEATFGSAKRDPNGLVGLVGIGRLGGEIATTDVSPTNRVELFISVLASLNIALFVFNLIPLLPLDGGHVAGALWESIRRSFAKRFKRKDPGPVDIARLIPMTFSVVVLLVGLTVFLIIADIVKPITLQ